MTFLYMYPPPRFKRRRAADTGSLAVLVMALLLFTWQSAAWISRMGGEQLVPCKDCEAASERLQQLAAQMQTSAAVVAEPCKDARIYVYDLEPFGLRIEQVLTTQEYELGQQANSVLELMFYELFWTSKCRTLDPEAADWFFMPLATQTIYLYRSPSAFEDMDAAQRRAAEHFLAVLDTVKQQWPFFNRSQGYDHIAVFPGTHGVWSLAGAAQPLTKNLVRIQHYADDNTFGYYSGGRDLVVPLPSLAVCKYDKTAVRPLFGNTDYFVGNVYNLAPEYGQVATRRGNRRYFAFFAGSDTAAETQKLHTQTSAVREQLVEAFANDPESLVRLKTWEEIGEVGDTDYLSRIVQSTFCLAPRGHGGSTRRTSDAILLGCIPVYLADHFALPYDNLLPHADLGLRVAEANASNLPSILHSIPFERVVALQAALLAHRTAYCYCCQDEPGRPRPMDYVLRSLQARKALQPYLV